MFPPGTGLANDEMYSYRFTPIRRPASSTSADTFSAGRAASWAIGCSSTPNCTQVGTASRADHTSRVLKTTDGAEFEMAPR
eukprot:scaffold5036_cov117-Isochrysis_galbana.AAC.6